MAWSPATAQGGAAASPYAVEMTAGPALLRGRAVAAPLPSWPVKDPGERLEYIVDATARLAAVGATMIGARVDADLSLDVAWRLAPDGYASRPDGPTGVALVISGGISGTFPLVRVTAEMQGPSGAALEASQDVVLPVLGRAGAPLVPVAPDGARAAIDDAGAAAVDDAGDALFDRLPAPSLAGPGGAPLRDSAGRTLPLKTP